MRFPGTASFATLLLAAACSQPPPQPQPSGGSAPSNPAPTGPAGPRGTPSGPAAGPGAASGDAASAALAPAPAGTDLRALTRVLASTTDVEAARPALAEAGLAVETFRVHRPDGTDEVGLAVTVAPPLDAAEVARTLGVGQPCAVSGDVHQRSWHLQACAPYEGDRLAASFPRAGGWWLSIDLAARPEGPLPRTVAGASPAYDLTKVAARVVRVEARVGEGP